MGFKATATPVAGETGNVYGVPVTQQQVIDTQGNPQGPAIDYPAPQPPEARDPDDLRSLLSNSDKELRISYAGIYQAVLQSQALYAAKNVMDVATWHEAVEEEVTYFMRRVLERSQKE